MRNLKKFLAVVVAVTMLLTAMIPAFAAESSFQNDDKATTLNQLDLYAGVSKDAFDPALGTSLTREQGVVLLLKMFQLTSASEAMTDEEVAQALSGYADAAKVSSWSKKAVAYAISNGIMSGKTKGSAKLVDPKGNLLGKELATLVLKQLGYTPNFNTAVGQLAQVAGSEVSPEDAITLNDKALIRDNAVGIFYGALTAKYAKEDDTVIGKLVAANPDIQKAASDAGLLASASIASYAALDAVVLTVGDVSADKLPKTVKATYSDGKTADVAVTWPVVDTTKAAAKTTIEGTVAGATVKPKIDVTVQAKSIAVDSITITNLREIVVKFNIAPTGDTGTNKDNYKVNDTNPASVSLSSDKLTATLLMANGNALSNYKTDNKVWIAKALGANEDITVNNVTSKDITVPTVEKVEATGPRNIKITASEPLDSSVTAANTIASLKLDNGLVALDSASVAYDGRTLTIKTLSDLSEASHSLEFVANKNIVDNAGFKLQPSTQSFTYAKDTSAITATVESSTETSVKIKFNKPVKANTFKGNANVYVTHTYNNDTNKVLGNSGAVDTSDDTTFTITFPTTKALPPGTTTLYLGYVSDSGTKVQDNYSNTFAAATFQVTTTADVTKPTADTVEFLDSTHVKVTFSEAVLAGAGTNGAENAANYTLKNGTDSITVSGAAFDGTSDKVVKLTTATMNGGTYTLTVKNVKDRSIAGNQIDEVTKTFTGTDKVAPQVTDKVAGGGIDVQQIAAKKVKIEFSEAMDVASVTDKTIYSYNGTRLDSSNWSSAPTIEMADSNKAVIITFPDKLSDVAFTVGAGPIAMGRVKDAAGNWIDAFSTTLNILAYANVTLNSDASKGEQTGKNSIKLTFDGIITGMTTNDFVYSVDGGTIWALPTSLTVNIADNKTYITLATADITVTTGVGVRVATYNANSSTRDVATLNAKNQYDTPLQFETTQDAADKMAPVLNSVAAQTVTAGRLKVIRATFSEALYASSLQDTDFTVDGFTVESIAYTSGNTYVDITLKDKDNSGAEKAKVTVGTIEDTSRNATTANQDKTIP